MSARRQRVDGRVGNALSYAMEVARGRGDGFEVVFALAAKIEAWIGHDQERDWAMIQTAKAFGRRVAPIDGDPVIVAERFLRHRKQRRELAGL